VRELRERGTVQFVYTAIGRAPLVVYARMEDENVEFSVS
jgi:hypothetical protein